MHRLIPNSSWVDSALRLVQSFNYTSKCILPFQHSCLQHLIIRIRFPLPNQIQLLVSTISLM